WSAQRGNVGQDSHWDILGLRLVRTLRSVTKNRTLAKLSSSTNASSMVTRKFEKLAAQLEFFDLSPFLYNRNYFDFVPDDASAGKRYFQLLNQVLDPNISIAEIAPLRHHADPKVRTLALAALYHRNDAHLLSLIVELTGDPTLTFPGYITPE